MQTIEGGGAVAARVRPVAGEPSVDLREVLCALRAVRDGDFSARLPGEWTGIGGKIADTFNDIVTTNERLATELERVGKAVGKQGKIRQRVRGERRGGEHGAAPLVAADVAASVSA